MQGCYLPLGREKWERSIEGEAAVNKRERFIIKKTRENKLEIQVLSLKPDMKRLLQTAENHLELFP